MELKPNVEFPLAVSYNERGLTGFTNVLANRDQSKVNFIYEPVNNQLGETRTLYLTKRPGANLVTSAGGSGQVSHLIIEGSDDQFWLFSTSTVATSTEIRVHQPTSSVTISTYPGATIGTTYFPAFADKTRINGIITAVLQTVRTDASSHRIFQASTFGPWTEIGDAVLTSLIHRGKMEHMDGYAFQLEMSSRIFNSNLNTVTTWGAGNFITKQITQDVPIGLARLNNQILAFGEETAEVFYNGGLTPAPLVPLKHLHTKIGMSVSSLTGGAGTHYYSIIRNTMYFCGQASEGGATRGAYAYNGSQFNKISPPYIDKIFAEACPASVESFFFQGQEAIAFRLSAQTATTQRWMMYFPRWNDWFEWNSEVFKPINQGTFFMGAGTNANRVFNFGSVTQGWTDFGTQYSSVMQFKWPTNGTRQQMNTFGVIGDTESNTTTSQLQVEFSNDDGQTFNSVRTIDMTKDAKYITRCGAYHQRTIRLTHVGNTEIRLEKVISNVK